VGDQVNMLQYSTYSISRKAVLPFCGKPLSVHRKREALGITANRLKTLGLIDRSSMSRQAELIAIMRK
jgi:acetyl-CoA carboxylase carboxyl transferase subunit alpha